jgi:lathosterol oxidase
MTPETPTRPLLDRWFERAFGEDAPTHLGSGWLSGTLAVFLGVIGLGAVAVLHYPQWLSSAELRAAYPMGLMRGLIELVIGLAFLLGCLNLLLRKKKRLGFAGIALAGLATLLGGAHVPIDGQFDKPVYLGVDWFLLNLLVLALIFVPLERLFPRLEQQGVFRYGWTTDGMYFLVSHVAVQLLTFLTMLPASMVAARLVDGGLRAAVAAQPVWLQVLEIMLLADLAQYWAHRAAHRISLLWPFHAVHHSSLALDWLAGSRLHLVDVIVTRSLVLVPVFLPGFSQTALYLWMVIIAFQAILGHVNMRFHLSWIEPFVVTPRFHHWHHAVTPIDKNFAIHFPWLDRLFGTYHMPGDAWPDELGLPKHPVPEGFLAQLVYPFRRG